MPQKKQAGEGWQLIPKIKLEHKKKTKYMKTRVTQLTQRSTVLLELLTVIHLIKIFLTFMQPTSAHH